MTSMVFNDTAIRAQAPLQVDASPGAGKAWVVDNMTVMLNLVTPYDQSANGVLVPTCDEAGLVPTLNLIGGQPAVPTFHEGKWFTGVNAASAATADCDPSPNENQPLYLKIDFGQAITGGNAANKASVEISYHAVTLP